MNKFLVHVTELKTFKWDILNPVRLINHGDQEEENKHYLIWRLRKSGDQALIIISTILKFSAQSYKLLNEQKLFKSF